MQQFDTLNDIKARHAKYHHFAKGLVETVNVYGSSYSDKEYGPYYCGLSVVMNIGRFSIYLRTPTSTTAEIEVAINFATKNGIILTLNNNIQFLGRNNKMINCSWISRYVEENERLFIGYKYMNPLKIESVRIVDGNKNYQKFFHVLWLFDSISSGHHLLNVEKGHITPEHLSIMEAMVQIKSNRINTKESADLYPLKCFELYLLNKKTITVDLDAIYRKIYGLNNCRLSFLFYDLHQRKGRQWKIRGSINKYYHESIGNADRLNLLRPIFLKLFRNLNNVRIEVDNTRYKFSLLSFLDVIKNNSR